VYTDRLVMVAEEKVVAQHEWVFNRDKKGAGTTVYDWRHCLSVLQRKPGALRNGIPFQVLQESFK